MSLILHLITNIMFYACPSELEWVIVLSFSEIYLFRGEGLVRMAQD